MMDDFSATEILTGETGIFVRWAGSLPDPGDSMRVRKFGHACLLVEERGEALLFDPGRQEFLDPSANADSFAGVSVIVVTHWHPDHADPDLIRRIIDRSGARVFTTRDAERELGTAGVSATVPDPGTTTVGAFTLRTMVVPTPRCWSRRRRTISPASSTTVCCTPVTRSTSGSRSTAASRRWRWW
jgi:L-ascorbate metabolism protein UlaG (beta-lactamase superfamily)